MTYFFRMDLKDPGHRPVKGEQDSEIKRSTSFQGMADGENTRAGPRVGTPRLHLVVLVD